MSKSNRSSPVCIVIAGPNGAGKTTFAREYLLTETRVFHFVNPGRLYFKVDAATVGEYRKRKMRPFRPNARQTLKSHYQVPAEILEDRDELAAWAVRAINCKGKSA